MELQVNLWFRFSVYMLDNCRFIGCKMMEKCSNENPKVVQEICFSKNIV